MQKENIGIKFHPFQDAVNEDNLPHKFTFPFFYDAHPLALKASNILQAYLQRQTDFKHDFGLTTPTENSTGKMFGVLVVKNQENKYGFIAAFSGKLADSNEHKYFVPPVYDMLQKNSFFLLGEAELTAINKKVEELENNPNYIDALARLEKSKSDYAKLIADLKNLIKHNKAKRKLKRKEAITQFTQEQYNVLIETLQSESIREGLALKKTNQHWVKEIEENEKQLGVFLTEIKSLKTLRKEKSAALQRQLFEAYTFLNVNKSEKSLFDIFEKDFGVKPISGAGECAAPKLLQFAFKHNLKPICMAEFWWGIAPNTEIRKHKNFYPACKSKCEPILKHMLTGLPIDENPLLNTPEFLKPIETIFENEDYLVINKPSGLLSVPGKTVEDCVFTRIRKKYPKATGPLIVHRLDMNTSGLMILAKTKEIHKTLQAQFIERSIQKRYIALLDGEIEQQEGFVSLPLRVDIDDRPRQLVCQQWGKPAKTKYQVININKGKTKVYFYPITGRTHQLRVHAAHNLGLNTPIVGDDLYGTKASRLHLHAELLVITCPTTGKKKRFIAKCEF